ncbi:MAG: M48 family metalloprotease [Spirochaetales bacterium]|nr:M48 family metalloprotease [Spirochaetales bacterium]
MNINKRTMLKRRLLNIAVTAGIVALMALLAGFLAWATVGGQGVFFFLIAAGLFFLLNPSVSGNLQLRIRGAQRLTPSNAPGIHSMIEGLAGKAGLARVPALYYIPQPILNAFTVGSHNNSAIVLTEGLIRYLDPRELLGVLAHEVGHIVNRDTWILGLAGTARSLTSWLSYFGMFVLFFSMPFFAASSGGTLLPLLLVIIAAPLASTFLFLALSRTREFDADIGAVKLTGDVAGFVSALEKLDVRPVRLFGFLVLGRSRREEESSTLKTHPSIRERIERLHELEAGADGLTALRPHIRSL